MTHDEIVGAKTFAREIPAHNKQPQTSPAKPSRSAGPPRAPVKGDGLDSAGREDNRFSVVNQVGVVACYRCGHDKPTHHRRNGFCVEFDPDLTRTL
jgi:hypothetical protein